jgi:hypothetical protein
MPLMEEADFWKIIDSSRERARKQKRRPGQDFMDLHEQSLAEALRRLSPEDIAAFRERFWYFHGKACGLTGKIVSHEVSGDGSRFECATEDRCPLTGQMVKGRDEVVIESPDRIVVTQFKTINGRETKVGEIVQTRQK